MSTSHAAISTQSPRTFSGRILMWGAVVGGLQAASPLAFPWLEPSVVYALGLAAIGAIYVGFAVADGRPTVIVVETAVAGLFVLVSVLGAAGPAWLLALGLAGHGFKDLRQHRHPFVANTRWWPPFCAVVDFVVASILVVLIVLGVLGR